MEKKLLSSYQYQNPVLKGEFADPDLVCFDGKWYIYPTTDGFENWSGTQFYVFSSEDGVNFKKENLIVDVASAQVPWATGCAWAPCIARKGNRFYYYFCAKAQNGNSAIGVAVASTPLGPFVAQPEPLITLELVKEHNIPMGQTIDPAIHQEDGKTWILFGNGNAAIVQLNEDMISLKEETFAPIEGAYDFREAIDVIKRNGIYHFTWSCDDTGSENYHLNYGTSASLTGPITYHYPVLEKDPSRDILGPGHHSILQVPDSDLYRIAYHRFVTPLSKYKDVPGKGYHRESCLADVHFDENGLMKKIEMPN